MNSFKKYQHFILPASSLFISVLVIIGWFTSAPALLSIIPNAPTMKFNTALLFLLSAIAIIVLIKSGENKRTHSILISTLGAIILIISGISILEDLRLIDINIDQLFVQDFLSTEKPGRMSFATASCFFGLGLVLILLQTHHLLSIKIANSITTLITGIGSVAIVTYFLQTIASSDILLFGSMAIHTAALFIILCLSITIIYPSFNYLNFIHGNYKGSQLIRKLFPVIVLIILLVNYITLFLINTKLLGLEIAALINTITTITTIGLYLVTVFRKLNKQEALREALELNIQKTNLELTQYKQALDKSSIVLITNADGTISYANERFYKTTGYTSAEVIGEYPQKFAAESHNQSLFESLWEKVRSGKVWMGGIKNKTKEGNNYWVHQVTIPLTDYQNNIVKYLSIQHDITEEKQLALQYQNVVNRNKELEQFTHIASHDLQEPIKSISGLITLLQELPSFEDKSFVKNSLDFMANSANRMREMISGLLDYSLIGKSGEKVIVDLNTTVENVLQDLRQEINEQSANISVGPLPAIKGYQVELYSLFLNLFNNALKYRRVNRPLEVQVTCKTELDHYHFSISDNGIGIEGENLKKIFSLFKRLHSRKKFAGSGLGLAHCEKIVQLHGGEIWAESEIGIGSTFHFTLPILNYGKIES